MEKYIYDNNNGLQYESHGGYYLSCLVIPEKETHIISVWDRKHRQYLKRCRPVLYNNPALGGKPYNYLFDTEAQALNKLDLLVTQLAEKEGINDQLKEQNQLAWAGAVNNVRNRAEEIVLRELIFAE